jgi:hypothetical protein
MRVGGHLDLSGSTVRALPAGLVAPSIDLTSCPGLTSLPADLKARRICVSGCAELRELPAGLRCYELDASDTRLASLPADLHVENRLDLSGCVDLISLPDGLRVGSLVLRGCTALAALPEGLDVYFLDISGCTMLQSWPRSATVRIGRLNARGCTRLRELPPWLDSLAQLDISGCASLSELPPALQISSWIDLADSGIAQLPQGASGAQIRWRGVPVDRRIAFAPETITAGEVFGEPNAERRRVLLERMGYEPFLHEAQAEVLDRDRDPGGERRLLRVALQGDEPLVCVSVLCPSTGRQYLIRVPPQMRTCRQAAAWIAGFDKPELYRPVLET